MNKNINTIFFDVGNTLLFPNREAIHAPLTARGYTLAAEHLRDLECRTKNQFDRIMTTNGTSDQSFWWMYYSQLFLEIGLQDDALRDELVASIRDSANWNVILPRTPDHLSKIGERFRIAVISNADGKIENVLQKCGMAQYFATITDSGLVGFEKPRPEIFRHALKSMNALPEQSLYVGDVYSVDYLGATGAGMEAMLMDVPGAYCDLGVPGVRSLEELRATLSKLDA
jgi:putative hydrolase of the HAD superfamily